MAAVAPRTSEATDSGAAVHEERHLVEQHRGEACHGEAERRRHEPEVGLPECHLGPYGALHLALHERQVGGRGVGGGGESVGQEAQVGGIAAHEEQHRREDDQGLQHAEHGKRLSPAEGRDEAFGERREHDPARRDAGGGDAERLAAPAHEPARHGGVVRQRTDAGRAERDGTGEAEVERGERVDAREHEEAHRQHERAHDLDRAGAVAVDGAADEQRVAGGSELQDREAARHRRVPTESLGQRPEEDAPGVEDHAGVDGVADEGDQHDPPAVEIGVFRGVSARSIAREGPLEVAASADRTGSLRFTRSPQP